MSRKATDFEGGEAVNLTVGWQELRLVRRLVSSTLVGKIRIISSIYLFIQRGEGKEAAIELDQRCAMKMLA